MRLRVEQYKMLMKRRDDLLTMPRPEFLATPDERLLLKQLGQLESSASGNAQTLERVARLKGVIIWRIETQYHDRFTEFDRNLRSLGESMTFAQTEYDEFVRARQAATHSYVGYETPVKRLRTQVRESADRIDVLMARQGHELEVAAIDELVARRDRLDSYRDKARFALADSYDRATQAQASREEP
jgi:hypothetical protein